MHSHVFITIDLILTILLNDLKLFRCVHMHVHLIFIYIRIWQTFFTASRCFATNGQADN